MEKVGTLLFDKKELDIYESLNDPVFRASDIARMLGYSINNTWKLASLCEEDEKLVLPMVVAGQRRSVTFVTETGLYNILSQSTKPAARKWRRVIHNELINLRKQRGYDIIQQFDEWDHALDNLYFDEDTGILMESVTVAGGDVIQVPYEREVK